MLSFNAILMALAASCTTLLVGFSWREQRWAPWLMLVAVVALLSLMSHSIVKLLS